MNLGLPEILMIFLIALLFFGPRKLPEVGRMLGKAMAEFRKATYELRSTLEREVEMEEIAPEMNSLRKDLADIHQDMAGIRSMVTSPESWASEGASSSDGNSSALIGKEGLEKSSQPEALKVSDPASPHPADSETPALSPPSSDLRG